MTTHHTRGPWDRNIRANGKYPVVFAGRNTHVAQVCQQKDGAETEANIDLIAAAPEMAAALERIIERWDAYGTLDTDDGARDIDDARALLRKALWHE